MYKRFGKRIFDLFIAVSLMILFAPINMATYFLLCIVNKGNPFFFQNRPGENGDPFMITKFKTMTDAVDSDGHLLDDELRMTSIGKIIRKLSIDELPQLFNVIKGDMSVVGPRPLLMQYMGRYSKEQARRHEVKPGITGWAQVNGRNAISWEEKFKLDVWYVENSSFIIDIKIIVLTALNVIKRDGINQDGHVTAKEFMGVDNE